MKKILALFACGVIVAAAARADTTLSVGKVKLIIPGGPCWDDTLLMPSALTASNNFTLTSVSGTGFITSGASEVADNVRLTDHYFYTYSVNLSGLSPSSGNHCISLLIHFGPPLGCDYDVLLLTNGTGVNVTSATLAPLGDITMTFGSGCLSLGNVTTTIGMVSDTQPKYGTVTIIDTYTTVVGNNIVTNETRVNVGAVVPQIPPDWAFAPPIVPFPFFQGILYTNPLGSLVTNPVPIPQGNYNIILGLSDTGSNGLPIDTMFTQAVSVVNGLLNVPLPFDPSSFVGNPVWLNIAVQPSNGPVTQLNPPLPLAPTPQAIYAYSAGVVANISSNQAVTSLDALTGDVQLQPGTGIQIGTNGNVLTIATIPGFGSDRNLKTDFGSVRPEDILARVAALPIESWRYTNELAGVHHMGPMAQDFQEAFGLGADNKMIYFVDEGGVALAAIQGLNQKLDEKDAEIKELKEQLDELKLSVKQLEQPQTK